MKQGDVYCTEIAGKYKCYFQYVTKDATQPRCYVIRVLKHRYPMDYKPVIKEIVNDDTWFYAHAYLLYWADNGWFYRVGHSSETGEEECRKVLFGCTKDTIFNEEGLPRHVNPIENWCVWHVGEQQKPVGRLTGKQLEEVEDGVIFPFSDIFERMYYGFYISRSEIYEFDIRRRIPFQHADIYVKKGYDNYSIPTYFYFHGNNLVRLVEIVDGKAIRMTAEDIAVSNHKMRGVGYSDIWWSHDDFISEEEFERVWNKRYDKLSFGSLFSKIKGLIGSGRKL